MTPERWRRLSGIFNAARELDAAQRDDFLQQECAGDENMRAELIHWLEEDAHPDGLLDRPVWADRTESIPDGALLSGGDLISDRYRIVRFIARGGMGEVYEAEDLELKGRVALKTLLPAIASDPRMIARFKQEIQLSRQIAHPNVCKVFDVNRHPPGNAPAQLMLLSMEYLAGETLSQRLERTGRMRVDEALLIVRQMAAALDAAHAAGVIHRDFKASNVMLAPSGGGVRAVVTDFGLARKAESNGDSTVSLSGKVTGTLDYMAPELLAGKPATIASDVYAFGMTIYRMLTGTRPFASDEPLAAAVRRGREPVPPPRDLASDLDECWNAAVMRCLEVDPARRFASAGDVVKAIDGEFVQAEPQRSPGRRRRLLAIAALTIVIAVVAIWTFWPRVYRPPEEAARLYRIGTDDLEAGSSFAATKALGEATRQAPDFSMAHARLAEAWTELESQEKASQEMVLAQRTEAVTRLSKLDKLYLDAVGFTITREYAQAARKYEEMLKYAGSEEMGVRMDLARVYDRALNFEDAKRNYLVEAQEPKKNPAAWLRLGVLYSNKGDAKKSDEAFARAGQLYELSSNQEGLTEVAYQRAVDANRRGEMTAAEGFLRDSLRGAQLTRNLQQEIRAKLLLGNTAFLLGDADAAGRYAQEAVDTATMSGLASLATRGLLTMGDAFNRKLDFEQAEKYYIRGLTLARQGESQRLVSSALLRLASLHEHQGKVNRSAPEAQEALSFYQRYNFALETLQCLVLLGRAKVSQGQYDAALGFYRPALEAAEKLHDSNRIMLAEEAIGSALLGLEQFPEALEHYVKELELGTALHNTEHTAYGALHCGMALWPLGRYAEAQTRFDQADVAAANFEDLKVDISHQRAEALLSEGKYSQAILICSRLLLRTNGDESDAMADLNRMLGLALIRRGRKREGRQHCERSFILTAGATDAGVIMASTLAVAEARLETGDSKGVFAALRPLESRLSQLPDSDWQAKSFEARASESLGDRDAARQAALAAQAQLDAIERRWGEPAFQAYRARPDLLRLWRPLLRLVSAKQ